MAAEGVGPTQAPRRGTGVIRITGLAFLDAVGQQSPVWSTGDPLTLGLTYAATGDVPGVSFSISFVNQSDLTVLWVGSGEEAEWEVAAGSGHVRFEMDSCLLAPGTYSVKVGVTAEGSVVDADDVGVPFVVRPGSISVGGLYHQPGNWSHAAVVRSRA